MSDRTCTEDGCTSKHYGRGLCANHYARLRRHGSTIDKRAAKLDPMARLLSRVTKTDGCWLWTGPPNSSGYGTYNLDGRIVGPHVAMVLLEGRTVPDGWQVDHLCVTPLCVRPDHLDVVTGAVNNDRSSSISSVNKRKTHCKRGHPFDEANTRHVANGRTCRRCAADQELARYHRLRA